MIIKRAQICVANIQEILHNISYRKPIQILLTSSTSSLINKKKSVNLFKNFITINHLLYYRMLKGTWGF